MENLDYQGKNDVSGKAIGKVSIIDLNNNLNQLGQISLKNKTAIKKIIGAANKPNKKITIFRATPGDKINNGDWVYITRFEAVSYCKTAIMRVWKPGYKVVKMTTEAKNIEWTGKALHFMLNEK